MVYRTKIVPWHPIVLVLPIVLPAGFGLTVLMSGVSPAPVGWFFLIVSLGALVLFSLVLWPCDYDPGASGADRKPILLVRSGLLRYRIPLAQISEVRRSAEAWSSPAWSLDRLKVVYPTPTPSGFHRSLLISPQDRDGFLDELARRAKDLERIASSLVREDHPRPPEARS
jgi:hypothetical protein